MSELDLSKYEGHTPRGMWLNLPRGVAIHVLLNPEGSDARLIADAPLLLDEVAALRKRMEELERELDLRKRLMHGLPICGGCMGKYSECQACRAEKAERDRDSYRRDFDGAAHACDKLQADLDAARAQAKTSANIMVELQADLDAALAERDKFASKAVEMELLWSGTNSDLEELERDVEALAVVAGGDPWPQRPEHQKAWDRIRSRALLEKRRENRG